MKLADIGELQLLRESLLPCVTEASDRIGDDCAHVAIGAEKLLWSMDPCPTPVAELLGICGPEVLGWYTAIINLSDIAACGGTPKGLLVSLEMPNETEVSFVTAYQRGLMEALTLYKTPLLGGNVKSAQRFAATGTVLGVEGPRLISRKIDEEHCDAFLIGPCGSFWASVVGHKVGWGNLSGEAQKSFSKALLFPQPQIDAGKALSALPFQIACMDCSDGPANALFQLATMNSMDLVVPEVPDWAISCAAKALLDHHHVAVENACYHFGDWQLACLIPHEACETFMAAFAGMPVTWMGTARKGCGSVTTHAGRKLRMESLNENFRRGYNSITTIDDLVDRYLVQPVFEACLP